MCQVSGRGWKGAEKGLAEPGDHAEESRFYVKENREPLKGCRHRFAFRRAISCKVEMGWESRGGGCNTAGGDAWY